MKKFLTGLLVALLAFLSGVLIVKALRVNQPEVMVASVEKIKVEEVKNDEIPFFKVEQSEESKKIETDEDFNNEFIDAWYSLNRYEKMPEVNMIKLSRDNISEDGTKSDKPILYSGIYTTLSDDIDEGFAKAIQITLKDNILKFKTKKLKGIEYRFQGIFFKNKMVGEQDEKVLRGSLQKFVKGKKVAEVSGDFAYYKPYCLH
ncbi:MAG TPA: hypothetical protein VGC97_09840 [Pyrinomonadaceae bacterium]|jgi:hypothetical protein